MARVGIYQANETGQITKVGSAISRLKIHALNSNGESLCGNKPAPGKVLAKLGPGRVTCERCAWIMGH